jgi:prephenate dehydrogenase
VAGTAPELVTAMCEGNAGALLPAMDDALGRLGATRGSLGSTGAVAATVRAGHQAWQQWSAVRAGDEGGHRDAGGEPGPGLDALLAGDPATVPARLRALGRAGGTLTG